VVKCTVVDINLQYGDQLLVHISVARCFDVLEFLPTHVDTRTGGVKTNLFCSEISSGVVSRQRTASSNCRRRIEGPLFIYPKRSRLYSSYVRFKR
jgi:hypothetical protein